MNIGHVLVSAAGELVSMDATFCSIMRASEEEMRGRSVLDVTAPADREECGLAIQTLRATGRPFEIYKRLLRNDGSLVWVKNSVSITVDDRQAGVIVATIEPVTPNPDRGPANLLEAARAHIDFARSRASVCDPKFFLEPGWNAIMALYVAEAEGRALDVADLADVLEKSVALTQRWVKALLCDNVIEIEFGNLYAHTAKSYRLTAEVMERLEYFLQQSQVCSPPPG